MASGSKNKKKSNFCCILTSLLVRVWVLSNWVEDTYKYVCFIRSRTKTFKKIQCKKEYF